MNVDMQSMIESIVVRLREVSCITCYVHAQNSQISKVSKVRYITFRATIFSLSIILMDITLV